MEKNKKKLAIWTHGGVGGGEFGQGFPRIVQIIERLAKHYQVSVYSASPVKKNFIPNGYAIFSPPPSVSLLFLRWSYVIALFLKNCITGGVDILYSFWGYPAGVVSVVLGKIFKRPSVVNILGAEAANLPEIQYGHLRKGFRKQLLLWGCRHASELIAVSGYQLKILEGAGLQRPAHIIPWGVDENQFPLASQRENKSLNILHVANLTEVKDQKTLLMAFKIIREAIPAKLRITGPDYLNGEIQKKVVELGLQSDVEFTGAVPYTQIVQHFHWADVFMLTSLSEGQNSALTEAMMCGVLPVSTAVGHMADLGNEAGIVTNVKDYATMAKDVIEIFNNPEEWKKRRDAALQWASFHNFDWTIHQLINVFESSSTK